MSPLRKYETRRDGSNPFIVINHYLLCENVDSL